MNTVLDSVVIHGRHTLEHISVTLGEIARDWDIHEKIVACVHDGASNCKVAGAANSWRDVHCAADLINLAMTSAIGTNKVSSKPISKLVGAASQLVKEALSP